ncbi:MAG: S8 family serine peptidase, partial [Mariniphaga sp.]|nr:S8 family serine peptidase [Mariniphaga sp.]
MKNLINILFVQLLFLIPQVAYNQTYDDFYYTQKGKVYLKIVPDRYVVEFPNGVDENLFSQQNIQIEKLRENIFIINSSFNDIQNLFGLSFISPVYETIEGNSIRIMFNEIILRFKEDAQETSKDNIINTFGLVETESTRIFNKFKTNNPLQISKAIFETGLVKYCNPVFKATIPVPYDGYIPTDAYFNKQFYLHNTGQEINDGKSGTPGADIKMPLAWEITKGSEDIVIAIIDEGVLENHPELPAERQVRLPGSNIFWEKLLNHPQLNNDPDDPSPVDNGGNDYQYTNHGNSCAGIAAAEHDNGQGIAGIAPNCKIMPVRIIYWAMGQTNDDYGKAITFAYEKGADIISMSFGWPSEDFYPEVYDAIEDAIEGGCIVIVSAGNNWENNGPAQFPANTDIPLLLSVGASDRNDEKAYYSPIDLAINISAPSHSAYPYQVSGESGQVWTIDFSGNEGRNPWPTDLNTPPPDLGEELPDWGTNNLAYTGRFGGTSAAAPQVAGCAALALSVNSNLSVIQINNLVKHTADKVGPYSYSWNEFMKGHSKELGYGRLNCYRMVKTANDMLVSGVDLYIRDLEDDFGIEPNEAEAGTPMWISPDIWIRNQNDGTVNQIHENPEYSATNPVYVYLRVTNKGEETSTGNEKLHLYWAKAGTDLVWKDYWDGSVSVNGIPMGGILGDQNVPIINP